jgi:hypothetical protein
MVMRPSIAYIVEERIRHNMLNDIEYNKSVLPFQLDNRHHDFAKVLKI